MTDSPRTPYLLGSLSQCGRLIRLMKHFTSTCEGGDETLAELSLLGVHE